MDYRAKMLRKEALRNISGLTQELSKFASNGNEASLNGTEDILKSAERKVEESRLRYGIMEEYYRLCLYKDIVNLKGEEAYKYTYDALFEEAKECAQSLFTIFDKLKSYHDLLTVVESETKAGFEYFANKLNEKYEEGSKIWKESQSLRSSINKVNRETNIARIQEFSDEPEA